MTEDDGPVIRLRAGAYNEGYQDAAVRGADRRAHWDSTYPSTAAAYREGWESGRVSTVPAADREVVDSAAFGGCAVAIERVRGERGHPTALYAVDELGRAHAVTRISEGHRALAEMCDALAEGSTGAKAAHWRREAQRFREASIHR